MVRCEIDEMGTLTDLILEGPGPKTLVEAMYLLEQVRTKLVEDSGVDWNIHMNNSAQLISDKLMNNVGELTISDNRVYIQRQ